VRFIRLCIICPVHYRVMTLGTCFATHHMVYEYVILFVLYHFIHIIVFHAKFQMFIICQCNIKYAAPCS